MLKIAFAVSIHRISPHYAGNCFLFAWQRFYERNKSNLIPDFFLVAHGWSDTELRKTGCPFKNVSYLNVTYGITPSIMKELKDYDYIIRIDYDAFVSVDFINKTCLFLEQNQDVDFLTPSNVPRTFAVPGTENTKRLYFQPSSDKPERPSYKPWGLPNDNGDVIVLRTKWYWSFWEKAKQDLRISQNITEERITSHILNYGEICEILGFNDPSLTEKDKTVMVHLDGTFQGDISAYLFGSKPVMSGYLDSEGCSFRRKNTLRSNDLNLQKWEDNKDEINFAYPHAKNVISDELFHLESSYMSGWYFLDYGDERRKPHLSLFQGIVSPGNFWNSHYLILRMLLSTYMSEVSLSRIDYSILSELSAKGIKAEKDLLLFSKEKLVSYYKFPLKEYL